MVRGWRPQGKPPYAPEKLYFFEEMHYRKKVLFSILKLCEEWKYYIFVTYFSNDKKALHAESKQSFATST